MLQKELLEEIYNFSVEVTSKCDEFQNRLQEEVNKTENDSRVVAFAIGTFGGLLGSVSHTMSILRDVARNNLLFCEIKE